MARRTYAHAVVLGLALFGAGCTHQSTAPEVNEYQIALKQIPEEYLKQCESLGPPPENQVGNLLQDFNDLSAVSAPCRALHNELVQYLTPLIQKAKAPQ